MIFYKTFLTVLLWQCLGSVRKLYRSFIMEYHYLVKHIKEAPRHSLYEAGQTFIPGMPVYLFFPVGNKNVF